MPIKSARQYGFMAAVAHGTARNPPPGLSATEAGKMVHETPAKKRSGFAKTLAKKRPSSHVAAFGPRKR